MSTEFQSYRHGRAVTDGRAPCGGPSGQHEPTERARGSAHVEDRFFIGRSRRSGSVVFDDAALRVEQIDATAGQACDRVE